MSTRRDRRGERPGRPRRPGSPSRHAQRNRMWLLLMGGAVMAVLVAVGVVLAAAFAGGGATVESGPLVPPDPHARGDQSAPVTVVEFADFQ